MAAQSGRCYHSMHLGLSLSLPILVISLCITLSRGFLAVPSNTFRRPVPVPVSVSDLRAGRQNTCLRVTRFHYNDDDPNSANANLKSKSKRESKSKPKSTSLSGSGSNSTMLDAHGGSDLPYLRVGQEYASNPSSSASNGNQNEQERGPFPLMPSQTFFNLANSQFELLSNSIHFNIDPSKKEHKHNPSHTSESQRRSKIKSIGLYLPQENPQTGQLEFLPSIVYPSHPKSERIFIASDAKSGVAPTIPKTLTQLPGFSHASTLIPAYPFIHATSTSSTSGGGPDRKSTRLNSSHRT